MKELIKSTLRKAGASDVGVCRARIYNELLPVLQRNSTCFSDVDTEKRINPFLIMPEATSVIVFIVSYKSDISGNLSSYAYGKDYHTVLKEIARPAAEILLNNNYKAEVFADTGNLSDRHLAYLAGLGFLGRNHCLIHQKYGSFVFIGYILTDCPLPEDKPLNTSCLNCGKCIQSCPSKALSTGDFDMCLSFITQKKGDLSEKETKLIKSAKTIWGCDICQRVCPHNYSAPNAETDAFSKNLITDLFVCEKLTNREFKELFGDRAFSWRGKNVLIRNQKIVN